MARLFEPLGGVIVGVAVDEDGFASIRVTHPACGTSEGYASSPLDTISEDVACSGCGQMLMRYTGEDGEEIPDAWGI